MNAINATIEIKGEKAILKSPYNESMINELRNIPNRYWDSRNKVWIFPAEFSDKIQEIVNRYFGDAVEKEIIRMKVWGGNTYRKTYPHGVAIDGYDLLSPWGSISRDTPAFKILECKGGFTYGDSRHAFGVEYEIVVECRRGALIEVTGRADYQGKYKILERKKK